MNLPLPDCVALHQNELWKHGADDAAADRSQGSHSGRGVTDVISQWVAALGGG